jgi:hypothetical protein
MNDVNMAVSTRTPLGIHGPQSIMANIGTTTEDVLKTSMTNVALFNVIGEMETAEDEAMATDVTKVDRSTHWSTSIQSEGDLLHQHQHRRLVDTG